MNYLLAFESAVGAIRQRNLIPAKKSSRLHTIIDSTPFDGLSFANLSIEWVKLADECNAESTFSPSEQSLKLPLNQRESEFKLTITETEFTSSVKLRFRIKAGATDLFGTFTEQYTSATDYANGVARWLRSKSNVKSVRVAGVTLYVRLNVATYASQALTVDIGTGTANSNSPTLTFTTGSSYTSTNESEYDIIVGSSVVKGNSFTLGGTTVTANNNDTATTIKYALSANGKFRTSSITPTVTASLGSQTLDNTNNATLEFTYRFISSVAQWAPDIKSYTITAGNIFYWGTYIYTVTGSEANVGAIEDSLYNGSTKYPASGSKPTWMYVRGSRSTTNTNSPRLEIKNKVSIPSGVYVPHTFTVGSSGGASPVCGNIYTINGKEVMMIGAMSAVDIAKKLKETLMGVTLVSGTNPFTVDIINSITTTATATVGIELDALERLAVLSTSKYVPAIGQTKQFLLQTQTPTTQGYYYLRVKEYSTAVATSNIIEVLDDESQIVKIECSDEGSVFGYETHKNFVHKFWAWGGVSPINIETEENEVIKTDGVIKREWVRLRRKAEVVLTQAPDWLHDTIIAMLKHREVWLNNEQVFIDGSYSLPEKSKGSILRTAKFNVDYSERVNDNDLVNDADSEDYSKIKIVLDKTLRRYGMSVTLDDLNYNITNLLGGERISETNYKLKLNNEHTGTLSVKYRFLTDGSDVTISSYVVNPIFLQASKKEILIKIIE